MAIRDEIITTLVEGLAAVQRRVNEVEALKATAGPRGERGSLLHALQFLDTI